MKVEFEEKSFCMNAEKGDIIEITGSLYLVVNDTDGDELKLVNLDLEWIVKRPSATMRYFDDENYKIIAKKGTFKIMRD